MKTEVFEKIMEGLDTEIHDQIASQDRYRIQLLNEYNTAERGTREAIGKLNALIDQENVLNTLILMHKHWLEILKEFNDQYFKAMGKSTEVEYSTGTMTGELRMIINYECVRLVPLGVATKFNKPIGFKLGLEIDDEPKDKFKTYVASNIDSESRAHILDDIISNIKKKIKPIDYVIRQQYFADVDRVPIKGIKGVNDGHYSISDQGVVRNEYIDANVMTYIDTKKKTVLVTENGSTIVRNVDTLVVRAFLEIPPWLPTNRLNIVHINGDEDNCKLKNLKVLITGSPAPGRRSCLTLDQYTDVCNVIRETMEKWKIYDTVAMFDYTINDIVMPDIIGTCKRKLGIKVYTRYICKILREAGKQLL